MLVQPSRTATVCEVDGARKRAASRLEGSEPRIPDKPLETYHPETIRLTATCSCEACSAFTRVAARTLARSPIRDPLYRRLQPFRHLHDYSGCFRLERSPAGTCTHWKAPPSHGARKSRSFIVGFANREFRPEPRVQDGDLERVERSRNRPQALRAEALIGADLRPSPESASELYQRPRLRDSRGIPKSRA